MCDLNVRNSELALILICGLAKTTKRWLNQLITAQELQAANASKQTYTTTTEREQFATVKIKSADGRQEPKLRRHNNFSRHTIYHLSPYHKHKLMNRSTDGTDPTNCQYQGVLSVNTKAQIQMANDSAYRRKPACQLSTLPSANGKNWHLLALVSCFWAHPVIAVFYWILRIKSFSGVAL